MIGKNRNRNAVIGLRRYFWLNAVKAGLGLAVILCFIGKPCYALSLKEEGEGKIVIENPYYQASLSPVGGIIKSLILKETGDNLTEPTGIGNDITIKQGHPGKWGLVYSCRIVEETKNRIAIRYSGKQHGELSEGIVIEKTYIFKEKVPLIEVKVRIINEGSPMMYGYRVHNMVKVGLKTDGDIYFCPRQYGMKEIKAGPKTRSTFIKDFATGWAGAIDKETGGGILYKPVPESTEKIHMWFGTNLSTIEWWYKDIGLEKGDIFETTYLIFPITGIKSAAEALSKAEKDTEGIKTASKLTKGISSEEITDAGKILIVGPTLALTESRADYRPYEVERSLRKLSFKVDIVECQKPGGSPSEHLKGFPVSLEGLSKYQIIIMVDVRGTSLVDFQENLISYVKEGGNLIFVGDHDYKTMSILSIIPLSLMGDKTSFLSPGIADEKSLIVRGIPSNMPDISVHKSKLRDGDVVLTAGDYPLLATKRYGKGKVISFPMNVHIGKTYDFLNDKLVRWDFYDELWRNIIHYCSGEISPVNFSRVLAPEGLITYPADAAVSVEVTNFSKTRQRGELQFILYKNGEKIDKKKEGYQLSPTERAEKDFSISLDYPRGSYTYKVAIKDIKGEVITYFDGAFSTRPETYLETELPVIKVFGRNSSIDFKVKVLNRQPDMKYQLKTELYDFRREKAGESSEIDVPSSGDIRQNLKLGNLMKGDYKLRVILSENNKSMDIVENPVYIAPYLKNEDIFHNGMFGFFDRGDLEQTLTDVRKAKEIGLNTEETHDWALYSQTHRHRPEMSIYFRGREEMQRQGMSFVAYDASASHWSWAGFWGSHVYKVCPNMNIDWGKIERQIKVFKRAYNKSPRLLAAYIADEPYIYPDGGWHDWQNCPHCLRVFKEKFGWDKVPGRKDRNYYQARKYIVDKQAENMKRCRDMVRKHMPDFKGMACYNKGWSLWDGLNITEIVSNTDFPRVNSYEHGMNPFWLDCVWGASNFEGNIGFTGASSCYSANNHPRYIATQVWDTLTHNGKHIMWFIWKHALGDFCAVPERVEAARRVFNELKQIGPLFKHIEKSRAEVAILHLQTTLILDTEGGTPYKYNKFYDGHLHTACRQAFGQVDVLYEEQIRKGKFLSDCKVLCLPGNPYITEDAMQRIREWVKQGGILIALPNSGIYNEYQEKSSTLTDIYSASWTEEEKIFMVEGSGKKPTRKIAYGLNPIKAKSVYTSIQGEALVTENRYGKGRAICFGFDPDNEDMEKIVGDISPWFIRSGDKDLDVSLFPDGENYYIAVSNQSQKEIETEILVKLPEKKYYIYDLLTGKKQKYSYQDNILSIPVKTEVLWGKALAVLSGRPSRIELRMDKKVYKRGDDLVYTVRLLQKNGRVLNCKLPVEIEVIDSEGRERDEYGGVRVLEGGIFNMPITLADNEPEGVWKIAVKEWISNKEIKQNFSVK